RSSDLLLEPTFGGINLEDIAAPNCFIIEERLKRETRIPIFHDDQHGTAIVTVAGLMNALKLVGKSFKEIKVVANGAGAAGMAIIKLLENFGVDRKSTRLNSSHVKISSAVFCYNKKTTK